MTSLVEAINLHEKNTEVEGVGERSKRAEKKENFFFLLFLRFCVKQHLVKINSLSVYLCFWLPHELFCKTFKLIQKKFGGLCENYKMPGIHCVTSIYAQVKGRFPIRAKRGCKHFFTVYNNEGYQMKGPNEYFPKLIIASFDANLVATRAF